MLGNSLLSTEHETQTQIDQKSLPIIEHEHQEDDKTVLAEEILLNEAEGSKEVNAEFSCQWVNIY